MKKSVKFISDSFKLAALFVLAIFLIASCKNQPAETKTKENMKSSVIHPDWSKNANIYEVNIRQYTPEGTFKELEKHLPRLKQMGVDILWLMPVHPVGEKNRKGTLGSYYSVKDYKDVNPEFGTMEDFKSLVDKAHELGMYVIIDWVANHSAWDNQMIIDHPEWYTKDSLGNFVSPYDWTDVADLNYENPELRKYMTNALKFWIEESDIDGYRCDVAGMVPCDFWDSVRYELDKIKPVFMLAEAEEPIHHKNAFDMSYGWNLHHIMNEIANGNKNANDIESYFKKNNLSYPQNAYRMYFTSNHDENSWNGTVYERMGDAAETFAALCATVPGTPLIYSGQEAALNKRLEFFEKDTIDWKNYELADFYTTLLKLKKNNKALWNGKQGGNMIRVRTSNDKAVFAFVRTRDNDKVFAIFNLTDQEQIINLKCKDFIGDYTDVFTGQKTSFAKGEKVNLEPWEFIICSSGSSSGR